MPVSRSDKILYVNEYPAAAVLSVENALASPRIAIESVQPVIEGGRFAAKAIAGRPVIVSAVVFADGHEQLGGQLLWRELSEQSWQRAPLNPSGNDHWQAEFTPQHCGRVEFAIEAWIDPWASYCDELKKKFEAGVNIDLELQEGAGLLAEAVNAEAISDEVSRLQEILKDLLQRLQAMQSVDEKVSVLLAPETSQAVLFIEAHPHRLRSITYPVDVDRPAAEFSSWYELFPRSATDDSERHGTFLDVIRRIPEISAMGFDVLYFPPIHPIGRTHRKGRNNALEATADDPGSPYAIGSTEGGHDAFHPQLGDADDFQQLVSAARAHNMEIALDFAVQCSPDHPWLAEHPGWFSWRPNGTIRYAENPPKKYEDIVNVNFYAAEAMPDLWLALRDVILDWVERGVTLFRVDNPHTKPMPFWEWLIADVRNVHPDILFLSEAFTRPAMMARLGKLGFSQSYTYFTWRNTRAELESYFTELNQRPWRDCYRPNFFVNTPDINPFFLHESGRAGFLIRAALAAMGSGSWGMYSGFELCESAPIRGKEEYLDSEKYQIKPRDYHAPGNIVAEITHLNRIRRSNPALQTHLGFQAYKSSNDQIFYFGKRTADLTNFILIAVSLDPYRAQEASFELPVWEFGLPDHAVMCGEDLISGHTWNWYGKEQWMRIEPWRLPFGIWRLRPHKP
jgi:starch synthase (maltosyl-transferring)